MSEYNTQRYYWIKLTDKFMTSDIVDFLMEQKDGANYVVIYQLLCLKTVNNNGCLSREIGEVIIPYDEEKIQRDLKWFTIDTIRVAMTLYKKLGLVYEQENGILKITNFEEMVGSQSNSALKKQQQRLRLKNDKDTRVDKKVDKGVDICPPDKDIEKEKDIDKDIEIDKELLPIKEKENISKEKNEFENLILLQEEPLREPLREFIKMRKTIRKPLTVHAFDLIIKDVKKFADGDIDKGVKILEQSIKNSYQGVFDLKEYEKKPKPIKRQLGIIV